MSVGIVDLVIDDPACDVGGQQLVVDLVGLDPDLEDRYADGTPRCGHTTMTMTLVYTRIARKTVADQ